MLTGETGAGKSILLDAFALWRSGARGDASLVRQGAEQGQVTAMFELPPKHPARALLTDVELAADEPLLLRPRTVCRWAHARLHQRSAGERAGVAETSGPRWWKSTASTTPGRWSTRRRTAACSMPTAGLEDDAAAIEKLWNARRDAETAVEEHRANIERAAREAEWLRHAVDELSKLAPEAGEETALAEKRTGMMQSEKIAGDLRDAHDAVSGSQSPVPALSAAVRRLERRGAQAPALVEPAVKAIDAALTALDEACDPSRSGVADCEPRSERTGADRGASVRAPRGRPQVQFAASMGSMLSLRAIRTIWR